MTQFVKLVSKAEVPSILESMDLKAHWGILKNSLWKEFDDMNNENMIAFQEYGLNINITQCTYKHLVILI